MAITQQNSVNMWPQNYWPHHYWPLGLLLLPILLRYNYHTEEAMSESIGVSDIFKVSRILTEPAMSGVSETRGN